MHTLSHPDWRRLRLTGLLVGAWSALLLLASGSAAATTASRLYDQNSKLSEVGMRSTVLNSAETADDFVVPAATSWHISTIETTGQDVGLTSVKVTIYRDSSGSPGTQVYSRTLSAGSFTEEPGPFHFRPGGRLTIPVDVTLASGHYWLSVQGDGDVENPYMSMARRVVANHAAIYRGLGCSGWCDLANAMGFPIYPAGSVDLMFALYGPGELLPRPAVSLGSVEAIGPTTATLTGTVDTKGFSLTDCHFEYGLGISSLGVSFGDLSNDVACTVLPGSGTSEVTVSATLTGLQPETAYSYALSASNASRTGESTDILSLFVTAAKPSHITCIVPKVKGKTLPAARKAITKAHCSVGKITRVKSSHRNKGHVVSQNPKPGQHVNKGTKVALKVGK